MLSLSLFLPGGSLVLRVGGHAVSTGSRPYTRSEGSRGDGEAEGCRGVTSEGSRASLPGRESDQKACLPFSRAFTFSVLNL